MRRGAKTTGVKMTTTATDEDRESEVGGRASCAGSKLPNYFSSCPRGPGKIIIKTSRGAG